MTPTRRAFLGTLLAVPFARGAASPLFEEVPASRSGITWVHDNAMSPQRYLPESLGSGCAFLDYDGDGWMDIYLVNSGPSDFWTPSKPVRNALYRNNRDGTFTDVTENAGVPGVSFGMGVAAADYNNSGHQSLFITAYGRTTLYRNNGDRTFTDVTRESGLLIEGWTTSAVWFDYDNDGRLDLFVARYVDYGPPGKHFSCGNNKLGRNFYCVPRLFSPTTNLLFHNNGDGTFTEVGAKGEFGASPGKSLGAVATDINNDGRLDLFVANDTAQNQLFLNRGNGKWEESALPAGVGFSADGRPRSGMGADAADLDGDGWQDLFVSNIDRESFSIYRNRHDETFSDTAFDHGVAQATRLLSGWGLKYFDYDNDGAVDLILANGHPDDMVESYSPGVQYREPLLLFHNEKGRLRNVTADAGPAFTRGLTARGLAVGDFDNDGRLDVLISNNGAAPLLLRNRAGETNHWLGLHLVGTHCNRDAIGARITW
ncbi:MAG TPA: VCBS repeat-containing protein, partial [Bryobacteraceae bacterium]|nr:VCBS repeat-containing protein [Bryobacteraceae bacterium]